MNGVPGLECSVWLWRGVNCDWVCGALVGLGVRVVLYVRHKGASGCSEIVVCWVALCGGEVAGVFGMVFPTVRPGGGWH